MGGIAHDEPAAPRLSVLLGLAGLGVAAATIAVVLVAGNEEDRAPWVRAALVGWIILAYLTCGADRLVAPAGEPARSADGRRRVSGCPCPSSSGRARPS